MARKLTRVALAISSAAMVLSLTASLAMAGEVTGPPNQIDQNQGKAKCACAGLNDTRYARPVRAARLSTSRSRPPRLWRFYGLPHGAPSHRASAVAGPARGTH